MNNANTDFERTNGQDLRSFLRFLQSNHPNEIETIEESVSPVYGITSYCLNASCIGNPVLLFKKVKGSSIPIVTNLFATRRRIALMLGTTEEKFRDVWRERAEASSIEPKIVEDGPVKEVVMTGDEVNLSKLPIPTHYEQDAGPYITAGVIVANDPATGTVNLSFARMQVKSRNRCGVSLHSRGNLWDYHRHMKENGSPLEVAVFIGAHPVLLLGAATRKADEYKLVSKLMMNPVELVKCETVDVRIPANAEIVLEGKILSDTEEDEGPFTEYTGYVSGRSTRNVMEITAITHRHDPIFLSISPSNSSEHILLGGISKQAEIVRQIKSDIREVVNINWPAWGTHFAAVMSIRNANKNLVRQAAMRLMQLDYYVKLLIVVDDDVNIFDEREYLWAVITRSQPDDDITILENEKGHLLDPSTRKAGITSKMVIDATKPEGWGFERGTIPQSLLDSSLSNLKREMRNVQ